MLDQKLYYGTCHASYYSCVHYINYILGKEAELFRGVNCHTDTIKAICNKINTDGTSQRLRNYLCTLKEYRHQADYKKDEITEMTSKQSFDFAKRSLCVLKTIKK